MELSILSGTATPGAMGVEYLRLGPPGSSNDLSDQTERIGEKRE